MLNGPLSSSEGTPPEENLTREEAMELENLVRRDHAHITYENRARYLELYSIANNCLSREEAGELRVLMLDHLRVLHGDSPMRPISSRLLELECIIALGNRKHAKVFMDLSSRSPSDLNLTEQVAFEFLQRAYPSYRANLSIFYF